MKKIALIVIIIFFVAYNANSQEFKIGISSGVGTYSMLGLKKINNLLSRTLDFDTKIVANFPPFFYFQPSLIMQYEKIAVGFVFTHCSTGSRISGKDYSGEYYFDMKVNSNSPGLYFDIPFMPKHRFNISFYTIAAASFSNLNIHEYLSLSENVLTDEFIKFKALSLHFQPGVKFSYSFKKFIFAIDASALAQLASQDFYTGNDPENKLYLNYSETIKPQWGGLRTGLALSYNLGRI